MVVKAVYVSFYRVFLIFISYNNMIFANALKTDPMCSEVEIVSRSEWKARPEVRHRHMNLPLNHIIILHTVTTVCKTKFQCIRKIQRMQEMHLDERGWWDIAYNFLIGGDGRVYEGRGWNHTGAHSVNFNTNSLGVAFIGNFNLDTPTKPMIDAAQNLIECGVRKYDESTDFCNEAQ
ncbi:peptidoglycan-recognition protein SC2-like, partial [Stegodyphus dumicola]|uniref:peptidoglycan-recognition protein SC2-like n=1 Tax=Stegodyphus dumicola TaxID=202533 RepID=UPI0015AC2A3E